MIIRNQFSVLKKFVLVSFLIFILNVITSLLWYKDYVLNSVYIIFFDVCLFGVVIWGSKTLIKALPDLKILILLLYGWCGNKSIQYCQKQY